MDWFLILAVCFSVSGGVTGLAILTYEGILAYLRWRAS